MVLVHDKPGNHAYLQRLHAKIAYVYLNIR